MHSNKAKAELEWLSDRTGDKTSSDILLRAIHEIELLEQKGIEMENRLHTMSVALEACRDRVAKIGERKTDRRGNIDEA